VDAGVVHLHLGTDKQQFSFGTMTQDLVVGKNSCAITLPKPTDQGYLPRLIDLTSDPSKSAPGLANYGLGVKESPSSGNGSPCAQIATNEVLTLSPGELLTGVTFSRVELDLELTGNAVALLTLSNSTTGNTLPFRLQSGRNIDVANDDSTTAPYVVNSDANDTVDVCAAPNSSGPNSNTNDNCRWIVTPGFSFDRIVLSAEKAGTVSLEGGGDFGDQNHDSLLVISNTPPTAVNDSAELPYGQASVDIPVLNNDSDPEHNTLTPIIVTQPANGTVGVNADNTVKYTATPGTSGDDSFTYQVTDGFALSNVATVAVRTCSGPQVSASDPATGVSGTFSRLGTSTVCKFNTVTLEFNQATSTILFKPDSSANTQINYRGVITFGPKAPVVDGLGGTTLTLKYDPDGDGPATYKPVPWCSNPHFSVGLVDGATIPVGDTWCIATETTTGQQVVGSTNVITTWQVFGLDDPSFINR
jgi:hypothetical protein